MGIKLYKTFIWQIFLLEIISHFWKSVTMELISVGRKSFGKNFWRIKFSWKKFLNFIIFLVKTSVGQKIIGKTFLWKKFLKLANPWTNLPLEKNSFGRMYFGKNFLENNFFGKNYLGNFYFGKNPLDIFTGCRQPQSPWLGIWDLGTRGLGTRAWQYPHCCSLSNV